MFRTVPLSIISSFSLYTQQWHMSYRFAVSLWAGSGRIHPDLARKLSVHIPLSYRFADSLRAGSGQICPDLARKLSAHIPLLCVWWKTPDDGQRNCLKHVEFYSKNKFEKLVHLVGFIIRNYHNPRSPERQRCYEFTIVTASVKKNCTYVNFYKYILKFTGT